MAYCDFNFCLILSPDFWPFYWWCHWGSWTPSLKVIVGLSMVLTVTWSAFVFDYLLAYVVFSLPLHWILVCFGILVYRLILRRIWLTLCAHTEFQSGCIWLPVRGSPANHGRLTVILAFTWWAWCSRVHWGLQVGISPFPTQSHEAISASGALSLHSSSSGEKGDEGWKQKPFSPQILCFGRKSFLEALDMGPSPRVQHVLFLLTLQE